MNDYDKSLQKLTATLKAREVFLKTFKDESTAAETYDRLAALAALDFVKAYKAHKAHQKFEED